MNKDYLKPAAKAFFFSFVFFIGILISAFFIKAPVNLSYYLNHFDKNNINYPFLSLCLFIFLFFISFFTGALDLTNHYTNAKNIKRSFFKNLVFSILFLILPFYILFHWYFTFIRLVTTRKINQVISLKFVLKKLIFLCFVALILIPVWIFTFVYASNLATAVALKELGYAPYTEYVAGTGSMYPTFPKGDKITPIAQFNQTVATPSFISYPSGVVVFNKRYFGREIKRGDIVSFSNAKTLEITKKEYGTSAGFIKRVIALSGDTIELRGGTVYLNSKPLKEPYTAKAQSTFGENFLSECKTIKVPKNSVFVMGDNRKGSGDSREIGFILLKDIDHVLPLENQKGVWDKNWRDTSRDLDKSSKIILDATAYLDLLNNKRTEAGVKPLKYEEKLQNSSKIRADSILEFDDFSFNATKSGITMQKAMAKAGYSNTTYGEIPTQGYFEASELIDNQFQFPKTKDFLVNKDFQEFGVSQTEGMINGCPTQIIVQHFAGYIPPNYPEELIKSWENALTSVNNVVKSWQDLKNYPDLYNKDKNDIDRINEIISIRQKMISQILNKMHANQWLSDEENQYTKVLDKQLGEEEVALAKKINDLLK